MKQKMIYSRPRMDKLLAQAAAYPLTSVVAGAGYGKTTAATEYLKNANLSYAYVPLTNGDPDVFWDKLCAAVEPYRKEAADALRVLGLPVGAWPVSRAVRLAREICGRSFLLCIDDYQLLPDDSPVHALVETLAFEDVPNLHILLLSRAQPNIRLYTLASKNMAFCIDADTLAFNEAETDGYLAMRGLRLTKDAVESIYETTGGWVSAIYLLGEGIRAGGLISRGKDIDALFEENLLKSMPETDREMLYRLSVFDSFPLPMAVTALGTERIRELVAALIKENAFITRNEIEEYRFHPLLREFLLTRCPQDDEQKGVFRRASLWYAAQQGRKYLYSIELVKKADCVEEYLAYFNKPGANRLNYYDIEAISRLTMTLPDDLCLKYPFSYLQICFFLLLRGDKQYHPYAERLFRMMQEYFSQNEHPYKNIILAELIIISRSTGFGFFNMKNDPLEEAAKLLGGRPSDVVNPADPFTFGLPMLLHIRYMKSGELDKTLARCRYNPYEWVSDGFGHGSEPLTQAEGALLRCQTEDARRFAEQAIAEASGKRQYFIMASAYSSLMRLSLFLGSTENAALQIDYIRALVLTAAREYPDSRLTVRMLRETLTLARCFFNASLMRFDNIPIDFFDGSYQSPMAGMGVPQMYCARTMYLTGNLTGALRLCETQDSILNVCQSARLCALILTALCREQLDGAGSGLPALTTALMEAQKDGVLLHFAENPDLLPLLAKMKHRGIQADFLAAVKQKCEAYKAVAPASHRPEKAPPVLSSRELAVLRLTAEGKSRAEVAAAFQVQENTVKAQLSSVYKKLDAHGKVDAIRLAKTYGILS